MNEFNKNNAELSNIIHCIKISHWTVKYFPNLFRYTEIPEYSLCMKCCTPTKCVRSGPLYLTDKDMLTVLTHGRILMK